MGGYVNVCDTCKHEKKECIDIDCPLWPKEYGCAGLNDLTPCPKWEPKTKTIGTVNVRINVERIDVGTFDKPDQNIYPDPLEERQALAEELSQYDAAGGDKNDDGKAPFHLIPPRALFDVTQAYADGIKKYKAHNWLRGLKWSRYFAAAMRHMWAWWMGEDYAPDSGVHHLAHAAACILNLLEYQHGYQRFDDRPNACLKQLLNEAKGAEA
jgi:hypothetical protein